MIVVKVELWSAVTGQVTEIARMGIDNIGGDDQRGDYRVRTYRGRSVETLTKSMMRELVTREGRVLGHERQRLHVWNLVAKALSAMGYGASAGSKPEPSEPVLFDEPWDASR